MAKLTLSVDKSVVLRAKLFAKQHSVSVSKLVEDYLDLITTPLPTADQPPVLRSVRGMLKTGDRGDYRTYLIKRHHSLQR